MIVVSGFVLISPRMKAACASKRIAYRRRIEDSLDRLRFGDHQNIKDTIGA